MPKTTRTPERIKLYEQIATLVAGQRTADAFWALAENLSLAVAFLVKSPEEAESVLRDCIPVLMEMMRENWDAILEAKNSPDFEGEHHV